MINTRRPISYTKLTFILSNGNSIKNNDFIKFDGVDGEAHSQAYDDGKHNDFLNNFWSDHEDPTMPYKIAGSAGNEDPEPASEPNVYKPSILSDPIVIYPNGGETLRETVEVKWENVRVAFEEIKVTYSVFIRSVDNHDFDLVADGLTDNFYSWDTTKVSNGEYLLKIVAYADGDETSDTSDESFKVNNGEGSTTITTSPGWTLFGILGTFIGVFVLKKKRTN